MADDKPLSDDETGDRLRKAVFELGEAPGATIRANAALTAARNGLALIPRAPLAATTPDNKPLSDVEAAWRLYNALFALGSAPGATPAANHALTIARSGIVMLGACLIKASDLARRD